MITSRQDARNLVQQWYGLELSTESGLIDHLGDLLWDGLRERFGAPVHGFKTDHAEEVSETLPALGTPEFDELHRRYYEPLRRYFEARHPITDEIVTISIDSADRNGFSGEVGSAWGEFAWGVLDEAPWIRLSYNDRTKQVDREEIECAWYELVDGDLISDLRGQDQPVEPMAFVQIANTAEACGWSEVMHDATDDTIKMDGRIIATRYQPKAVVNAILTTTRETTMENAQETRYEASIHVSNFGSYGGNIPTDLDGYTHTTAKGWLDALSAGRVDTGTESVADLGEWQEWAEAQASAARDAVGAANDELQRWRDGAE